MKKRRTRLNIRAANVRAIKEDERRISACASTEEVDAYGTILRAAGWDFTRFDGNPILLFAHDAFSRTPVGHCENYRVEGTELLFDAVFDDTTPFDNEVWEKYRKGVMRGFSVRFDPQEYHIEKINNQEVLVYTKQALMEISCVPIPANAGALARAERGGNNVKRSEFMKSLREIAEGDGDEDEKKKAAELYEKMGGEEGEKKAAEDEKKADEEEDEEESPKSSERAPKRASKRSDRASVDMAVRLAKLEKNEQQREVRELVEQNEDRFTPATRAWALEQPIGVVRSFVKKAPKLDLQAPQTTKPATRGDDTQTLSALRPDEEEKLDRILGIQKQEGAIGFVPNSNGGAQTFRTYTAEELRTMRQEKRGAK